MWHSMAMAASDISQLDSETAPLRVYVQELRPTPEDNLEIIVRKWWVCPPPGVGGQRGVAPGRQGAGRVLKGAAPSGCSPVRSGPCPGLGASRPGTQGGPRSVGSGAVWRPAGQLWGWGPGGLGGSCREPGLL